MKKYRKFVVSAAAVLIFFAGNQMPIDLSMPATMISYAKAGQYMNIKKKPDKKEKAQVNAAVKEVKKVWKESYDRDFEEGSDRYVEIKNTRVVKIKEDTKTEDFKNIDYIVEFIIFSNYYLTSPYYVNSSNKNCVTVYRNGTTEVGPNLIDIYRARTYNNDFSGFIESVTDFENAFNEAFEAK